jgi:hypothetical protein
VSEARYLVVGLTDEGEELRRVTVVESKLQEASEVFAGFSDWIDVYKYKPDGTLKREKPWSRSWG